MSYIVSSVLSSTRKPVLFPSLAYTPSFCIFPWFKTFFFFVSPCTFLLACTFLVFQTFLAIISIRVSLASRSFFSSFFFLLCFLFLLLTSSIAVHSAEQIKAYPCEVCQELSYYFRQSQRGCAHQSLLKWHCDLWAVPVNAEQLHSVLGRSAVLPNLFVTP